MKKILLPLLFIAFFSCQKEEEDMSKVINVELKQNESFYYTINGKDDLKITEQAMHAKESKIAENKTSSIFNYIPENNFSGTDEVIIHQGSERKGHCHSHSGSDYIFRITVTDPAPAKHHFSSTICPAF